MSGERERMQAAEDRLRRATEGVRTVATLLGAVMQPGGKAALHEAIEHERATLRLQLVAGDHMPALMPEVERRAVLMGSKIKALDSVTDDVIAARL